MKTIRSAADRAMASHDVAMRTAAMVAVEERLRVECGMGDDMVAHAVAPMRDEIALIDEAIARFDASSGGVLPSVGPLEDLDAVLVASRMALGESQREFALRIGMSPGTVYKHEMNGWGSVTLRRLSDIFARLPVVLGISARMASEDDHAEAGLDGDGGEGVADDVAQDGDDEDAHDVE